MTNKMKFIQTTSSETAHKLRYEGYTELTQPNSDIYFFLNDGQTLRFNLEEFEAFYTNTIFI